MHGCCTNWNPTYSGQHWTWCSSEHSSTTLDQVLQWPLHPDQFRSFLEPLIKHSAALHSQHVQYLADRDVSKVTWFEGMMVQVPKSLYYQSLTGTKNMRPFQMVVCIYHIWDCDRVLCHNLLCDTKSLSLFKKLPSQALVSTAVYQHSVSIGRTSN